MDQTAEVTGMKGIIVMWAGQPDEIPQGWLLCDGTNQTPDLRERFILGSADHIGETGGGTATLSMDNMPAHQHGMVHSHDHDLIVSEHDHSYSRIRTDIVGTQYESNQLPNGSDRGLWTGDQAFTEGASPRVVGGIAAFEGESGFAGPPDPTPISVVPSYYKLAFIMKS